ncbi:MAG: hypothetical protein JWQ77_3942 [Jatrophihabitans sp.]|nr:hypothetical protein [Jatrophihabitans sp.]
MCGSYREFSVLNSVFVRDAAPESDRTFQCIHEAVADTVINA